MTPQMLYMLNPATVDCSEKFPSRVGFGCSRSNEWTLSEGLHGAMPDPSVLFTTFNHFHSPVSSVISSIDGLRIQSCQEVC